ncbi:MAG: glycerate kinase [Muribaculaceae bacterium]|jgi:glycerate kinase|nr:glycerate kinase [Muribaculaceae bacterium]
MQKKIIVAIDSLKGCLSSEEANEAACKGIKAVLPDCHVTAIPVSDGGEGMMEAFLAAKGGEKVSIRSYDPLLRPIDAEYVISDKGKTAIIEMAKCAGLTLLKKWEQNPMETSSYGFGIMLKDALERDCRNIIIGIGGSATNDGGMGMLTALGFSFFDKNGDEIDYGYGKDMLKAERIASFTVPTNAINRCRITVACDVDNPFYGENGSARIFARQKGADEDMMDELDKGMRNIATIYFRFTGKDISYMAGAGAAGGMGGALMAMLNAKLKTGIDMLLDYVDFNRKIKGADLVITGEGQIDRQTLMGKVPYGIMLRAQKKGVPTIAIAGMVNDEPMLLNAGFNGIFSINPPKTTLCEAIKPETAKANIESTIKTILTNKFDL